jgi:uncharacterized protein DUF6527
VIDGLVDWWRRRRWTKPRIKQVVVYRSRADVPEQVRRQTLAFVGSHEQPKWAVLECPCGRGHQLVVNLSSQREPCWELSISNRGPSLSPSIDSFSPYRCHFWLRSGRVSWARDAA